MAIKAADQITIVDLTDGYSVSLTRDSVVFSGNAEGQVTSEQSTTTTIQALRGTETPTISVNPNNITKPTGINVTYNSSTYTLTITATVAVTASGSIVIPIDLDGGSSSGGVTIEKVFSYSINKTVATGTSIVNVVNHYLATSASSGVTKDTAGWTTTIQQMTSTNQYLWNYEDTIGTGDVVLSSTAPVIIGRYGQNGQNGINGQDGAPGRDGVSATIYYVQASTNVIARSNGTTFTPATITFSSYTQTGSENPTSFSGKFVISESTDGSTFTDRYTSKTLLLLKLS